MQAVRRSAWVLAGLGGVPALLFGVLYLYSFIVIPVVFGLGMATPRSQAGTGFALGLFCALVIGLVFGLGLSYGTDDAWFLLVYGTSGLLLVLATFKVGMVARLRFRDARSWDRVGAVLGWTGAGLVVLFALLILSVLTWSYFA